MMTLARFLEIAEEWQKMGWAVQAQLENVAEGGDLGATNPNALDHIWEWLR